jgi:hypothetical protein
MSGGLNNFLASGCNGNQSYITNRYHIGDDIMSPAGTTIKAVRDGTVKYAGSFGAGWGNVVFVLHTAKDGSQFVVEYGHIDIASGISAGTTISTGQKVGTVYNMTDSHLHLGVRPGTSYPSTNWGMMPCTSDGSRPTNGFVDPLPYLAAHPLDGSSGPPPPPPAAPTMMLLDGSQTIYGKNNLDNNVWIRETDANAAKSVVAGGTRQSEINLCDAVWSKDTLQNGGWAQETNCASAKVLRSGSSGTRVILDFCGAIYAKSDDPGFGGWVKETECGAAKDIQIGGSRQVILDGCNAIYTRDGVGYGGWTKEADCNAGTAITVSSDGTRVILNGCNALWAKSSGIGYGGWMQETGCYSAKAIAANGGVQLILNLCGAIYAKPGTAGWGGWMQEIGCYSAQAISTGSNGRQVLLALDNAVWAKDGIGYGGWSQLTSPGSAVVISAG